MSLFVLINRVEDGMKFPSWDWENKANKKWQESACVKE
jgi:hypothetical protein